MTLLKSRISTPYPRIFGHVSRHPSGTTPVDELVVDSYPRGYPRMAACQACDANFSIYRKFGWLHNRVLLHLQAELAKLEFDLQMMDDNQAESREFKERVGLMSDGREKARKKETLTEIKTKLAEYDDLYAFSDLMCPLLKQILSLETSLGSFQFLGVFQGSSYPLKQARLTSKS